MAPVSSPVTMKVPVAPLTSASVRGGTFKGQAAVCGRERRERPASVVVVGQPPGAWFRLDDLGLGMGCCAAWGSAWAAARAPSRLNPLPPAGAPPAGRRPGLPRRSSRRHGRRQAAPGARRAQHSNGSSPSLLGVHRGLWPGGASGTGLGSHKRDASGGAGWATVEEDLAR